MHALSSWINELISKYSMDLFRYKGVIAVQGMEKKFIFQGVHMLFGGDFGEVWGQQERKSCFCFIGRNIKRMELEQGFRNCIAKPLRWGLGQKVKAKVSQGWTKGEVIALWDDGNACRIQLNDKDKTEVWAPVDDNRFVMADFS